MLLRVLVACNEYFLPYISWLVCAKITNLLIEDYVFESKKGRCSVGVDAGSLPQNTNRLYCVEAYSSANKQKNENLSILVSYPLRGSTALLAVGSRVLV